MSYFVPFDFSDYPVKTEIPVHIWDRQGRLLLARGQRFETEAHRDELMRRRPVIKGTDASLWQRVYLSRLDQLLRDNRTIGELVSAGHPSALPVAGPQGGIDLVTEVQDLIVRASRLYETGRDPVGDSRALPIARRVLYLAQQHLEGTLLCLLWSLHRPQGRVRAIEGLLLGLVHLVIMRKVPTPDDWLPDELIVAGLSLAARTPEVSGDGGTLPERAEPDQPVADTESLRRGLFTVSQGWVEQLCREVVERASDFHTFGRRLYRMNQRIGDDMELLCGRALQLTFGAWVPGICVELANKEVAIITRSPRPGCAPRVLSFIRANGNPIDQPIVRDVAEPRFQVRWTVPAPEIRVRVDPSKLLSD